MDKLDTLVGALSAGIVPTGSQDPYGLLRAANGIDAIVLDPNIRLSLAVMCRAVLEQYHITGEARSRVEQETLVFLRQRLRTVLIEEGDRLRRRRCGARPRCRRAGAGAHTFDPHDYVDAAARARALWAFLVAPRVRRSLRVRSTGRPASCRKDSTAAPQGALIREPAEQALRDFVAEIGRGSPRSGEADGDAAPPARPRPLLGAAV